MIINLSFQQVNKLCNKLSSWNEKKAEKFILQMPKAGVILDKIDIAMLGFNPDDIYKKMLKLYSDNQRALNLIDETIQGNLYYRE
ncbi:hypothetical protein [Clostridium disporicum]|uniref:Uncharacterized protein n=1 Tax=Clostridium disporicum TaxID=84024 RepID=A0A174DLG1_9CLOT|nr:hypothetical protein [Clostridium disporicum]CUO26462.1 Uncharacterised protein [Clostridium disporicum]